MIDGGQYSAGSYESSSLGTYGDLSGGGAGGAGGYGGITDLTATNLSGAGNIGSNANYSSYEQSSYGSSLGGVGGTGEFDVSAVSTGNLAGASAGVSASSSSFEASGAQQHIEQYATTAQGLYQDPNPQIIRRPSQSGQVTYTQNIKIRFLQPPPIPPPGVSLLVIQIVFIDC